MTKYKLNDAIKLVAKHGFEHLSMSLDIDNPMVTIHQCWTPKGKEFAEFRKALGKWKGSSVGWAYREKFTY